MYSNLTKALPAPAWCNPSSAAAPVGEDATYQKTFQKPFVPSSLDVFIAVMGMTGSGKSTFISHSTDEEVSISDPGALESCTQEVRVHRCKKFAQFANVYLVDTPGFDDTNRKDTDILKEIARWLGETYQNKIKIRGILYLHRISDNRMGGCARKNLIMFKNLCGPQAIENVIFLTTFWEKVTEEVGKSREMTLQSNEDFWGFFVRRGAKVDRHWNNSDSALSTIARFVPGLADKPPAEIKLAIQSELVDSGKSLNETSAGLELQSEFQNERESLLREIRGREVMMADAMKSRDEEMMELLRQEQQRQDAELSRRDEQIEDLKTNMTRMHEEKVKLLEAQLLKQQQQQESQRQAIEFMQQQFDNFTQAGRRQEPPPTTTTSTIPGPTKSAIHQHQPQMRNRPPKPPTTATSTIPGPTKSAIHQHQPQMLNRSPKDGCVVCIKGYDPNNQCLKCGKWFSDRSALFNHIEKAGHAVNPESHKPESYVRPFESRQRDMVYY